MSVRMVRILTVRLWYAPPRVSRKAQPLTRTHFTRPVMASEATACPVPDTGSPRTRCGVGNLVAQLISSRPSMQSKLLTHTARNPQNARAIMASTGEDILIPTRSRPERPKSISNQVAIGLRGRLSPTALIGVVAPATAPATARHVSGIVPPDTGNESKKPQRKSPGRGADQHPGPGQHR